MNTLLRILFCIALLITGGLAALQYLALVPPGMIPQDWIIKAGIAATLLGGLKEGIVGIGDILDDGVRNNSFSIDKLKDAAPRSNAGPRMLAILLFVGLVSFMLASCAGDKFMGLTGDQWGNVAMTTGKELGRQLPGAAMQAYATERMKPSSKQPLPSVNPAAASNQSPLLLPPAAPEPKNESWFSGFRLF